MKTDSLDFEVEDTRNDSNYKIASPPSVIKIVNGFMYIEIYGKLIPVSTDEQIATLAKTPIYANILRHFESVSRENRYNSDMPSATYRQQIESISTVCREKITKMSKTYRKKYTNELMKIQHEFENTSSENYYEIFLNFVEFEKILNKKLKITNEKKQVSNSNFQRKALPLSDKDKLKLHSDVVKLIKNDKFIQEATSDQLGNYQYKNWKEIEGGMPNSIIKAIKTKELINPNNKKKYGATALNNVLEIMKKQQRPTLLQFIIKYKAVISTVVVIVTFTAFFIFGYYLKATTPKKGKIIPFTSQMKTTISIYEKKHKIKLTWPQTKEVVRSLNRWEKDFGKYPNQEEQKGIIDYWIKQPKN